MGAGWNPPEHVFRRHLAEPEDSIELNLIPLIDIIMFLLIFFISTTSFIEEPGVQVGRRVALAEAVEGFAQFCGVDGFQQIIHGIDLEGLPSGTAYDATWFNRKFCFSRVGHSFRMTELEAALGLAQCRASDMEA